MLSPTKVRNAEERDGPPGHGPPTQPSNGALTDNLKLGAWPTWGSSTASDSELADLLVLFVQSRQRADAINRCLPQHTRSAGARAGGQTRAGLGSLLEARKSNMRPILTHMRNMWLASQTHRIHWNVQLSLGAVRPNAAPGSDLAAHQLPAGHLFAYSFC